MTKNTLIRTVAATVLAVAVFAQVVSADTIFYDDFEDGDAQDGMPVTWEYVPDRPFTVDGGNLIIANTINVSAFASASVDLDLADTSVRTQAELRAGNVIGIIARFNDGFDRNGYFGYVRHDGLVAVGVSGTSEHLSTLPSTGLQPLEEEIAMQLDVIDDQIRFWAWPGDDTMPADPMVTATATFGHLATGDVIVWTGIWGWPDILVEAAFRYVHVSDTHIVPEPSTFALAALAFLALLGCVRRR